MKPATPGTRARRDLTKRARLSAAPHESSSELLVENLFPAAWAYSCTIASRRRCSSSGQGRTGKPPRPRWRVRSVWVALRSVAGKTQCSSRQTGRVSLAPLRTSTKPPCPHEAAEAGEPPSARRSHCRPPAPARAREPKAYPSSLLARDGRYLTVGDGTAGHRRLARKVSGDKPNPGMSAGCKQAGVAPHLVWDGGRRYAGCSQISPW